MPTVDKHETTALLVNREEKKDAGKSPRVNNV